MNSRAHSSTLPQQQLLCRIKTYVRYFAVCAAGLFIAHSTAAQLVPQLPNSVVEWSGANPSNSDWGDSGNWLGGSLPSGTDHVLFRDITGTDEEWVNVDDDPDVASLWFEAGTSYVIGGTAWGVTLLGGAPGGYLIVVRSDGSKQSEVTIGSLVNLLNAPSGWGLIENYSEGGLNFDGYFLLGDRKIRFGGTGAIRVGGMIIGAAYDTSDGSIAVGGSAADGTQPHLVLSGYNRLIWRFGELLVENRGFAIVKGDQALGGDIERRVYDGGTLGFRSHLEQPLAYLHTSDNDEVQAWGLSASAARRTPTKSAPFTTTVA